jgi:hypothetical protein
MSIKAKVTAFIFIVLLVSAGWWRISWNTQRQIHNAWETASKDGSIPQELQGTWEEDCDGRPPQLIVREHTMALNMAGIETQVPAFYIEKGPISGQPELHWQDPANPIFFRYFGDIAFRGGITRNNALRMVSPGDPLKQTFEEEVQDKRHYTTFIRCHLDTAH